MTNRDLQKYAVYKQDGSPWTQEEYEIVSHLMGDTNTVGEVTYKARKLKYIYTLGNVPIVTCFMHYSQNIESKVNITLSDFLDLVSYKDLALSNNDAYWTFQQLETIAKLTGLNKAGPELEHDVTSRDYVYYSESRSGFYCWGNQNTIKVIEEHITFPYHLLEELVGLKTKKPKNLCSDFEGLVFKPEQFKFMLNFGVKAPLKTVAINSLMKITGEKTMTLQNKLATAAALLKFMSEPTPRRQSSKGKYLSLSIKNGQSNVKSLIHQAMYTGIKDPRPYIKDLIQRELNRLTTDVSTMNLESIDYGFNIKLASQVSYFKGLKAALAKNDITGMDIQDAVNFYNFKKELVSYEKARISNNNVCPYLWVSNHLKADVLDKPGLHTLFVSNNIIIIAKDGKLSFESTKESKKYSVNIKLNVATGLYSI